jgi:hypoxanthine phosphoribosyltransferase
MEGPSLERRFEAERIAGRVAEVARRLDEDFRDRPPVLLSILKGAAFFAADLARHLKTPVTLDYINVKRAEGSDEILQIDFATGFALAGRPVVLLKDVVNTGVIETYLSDQLRGGGVETVRIAAIVDKPHERKTDLSVDYPLFTSEGGTFVGYGMEYRGFYGNLPYVAEIAAEQ